jgi:hypothetical protein
VYRADVVSGPAKPRLRVRSSEVTRFCGRTSPAGLPSIERGLGTATSVTREGTELAWAIAMPVKQHDVDRHEGRRRYCFAPAESLPETGLFVVLEPAPPDTAPDWEFPPGSVVRCESIIVGRTPCWVAREAIEMGPVLTPSAGA